MRRPDQTNFTVETGKGQELKPYILCPICEYHSILHRTCSKLANLWVRKDFEEERITRASKSLGQAGYLVQAQKVGSI